MSKLAARYRLHELEAEHRARLRDADVPEQTAVAVDHAIRRYEQTKGGDRRELRGLPLFPDDKRGLPGAIALSTPGTDAHLEALDRNRKRRRMPSEPPG